MQGLQFAQAVIFGQTVGNLMELSLPKVPQHKNTVINHL